MIKLCDASLLAQTFGLALPSIYDQLGDIVDFIITRALRIHTLLTFGIVACGASPVSTSWMLCVQSCGMFDCFPKALIAQVVLPL